MKIINKIILCLFLSTLFASQNQLLAQHSQLLFSQIQPGSKEYARIRRMILESAKKSSNHTKENNIDKILPGLYLGNDDSIKEVHKKRISHVLTVKQRAQLPREYQVQWQTIAISDTKNIKIAKHFESAFKFIDSAYGPTLVQCAGGHSRSTSYVIAYLMYKFDLPFEAAYHWVKLCRPTAKPNPSFYNQLLQYEAFLKLHPHTIPTTN